jgi:hypothetical protein
MGGERHHLPLHFRVGQKEQEEQKRLDCEFGRKVYKSRHSNPSGGATFRGIGA